MPEIAEFDPNLVTMALAQEQDFFEIKHFLKQRKESSANRHDRIYIVRYHKRLVGIAKLVRTVDSSLIAKYWLRGLYIDESLRHKGLASQLLNTIQQDLSQTHLSFEIAAFPYQHLEFFYQQNGFQHIEVSQLTEALQDRYLKAQKQQKNWLCMMLKNED